MNLDNQFQEFEWAKTITRCVRYFDYDYTHFPYFKSIMQLSTRFVSRLHQAGVLNGQQIRTDQVYEGKLTQSQYFR